MRNSSTFLQDHSRVLWLALAARESGTRASELAGVEEDVAALDFDLACAFRLMIYDRQCREHQAILIAQRVGELFGDGKSDGDRGQIEERDLL